MKTKWPKWMISASVALGTLAGARAHPGHEALISAGVPAAKPEVRISVEGEVRVIRSNGIPDHATGPFPGRGNPNTIAPQRYEFRVTTQPRAAEKPTPTGMNPFGVAVNGVVFDPAAAEWWRDDRASGWQYEALGGGRNLGIDAEHAHVQPTGAYHYHGVPSSLVQRLTGGEAADGPRGLGGGWLSDLRPVDPGQGRRPRLAAEACGAGLSDQSRRAQRRPGRKIRRDVCGRLGICDGRWGSRCAQRPVWRDAGISRRHLLLCPHRGIPVCAAKWRGTPDPSFMRRGPGPGGFPPGKKKKQPPRP